MCDLLLQFHRCKSDKGVLYTTATDSNHCVCVVTSHMVWLAMGTRNDFYFDFFFFATAAHITQRRQIYINKTIINFNPRFNSNQIRTHLIQLAGHVTA